MSIRMTEVMNYLLLKSWSVLVFISRLLKSVWLFFPGILFLVLAMWCFWSLNQGKDIIVAFSENQKAKAFFFIAIAFWIYVSWYSARVIAYLKRAKQEDRIKNTMGDCPPEQYTPKFANNQLFDLPTRWLQIFPHIIGFACLLVIELAVLQSPVRGINAISGNAATWFFVIGLTLSSILDYYTRNFAAANRVRSRIFFYVALAIFIIAAIIVIATDNSSVMSLFWVLLLLHMVYLLYINLRKELPKDNKPTHPILFKKLIFTIMDFLRIPRTETGYFGWFNIIAAAGLIIYLLTINSILLSWKLGPFPLVLLSFAVLLGFGNILTALSVKSNINLHFIIFILALAIGSKETHYVRTKPLPATTQKGIFSQRQDIITYYTNWIKDRGTQIDSAKNGYPVYFVLANGGASRSGYWTASVLGALEDATTPTNDPFSKHLFCLSGTSGGGVGVATFFSLLYQRDKLPANADISFLRAARLFLKKDFLTHTLAHMLGPDYFKYIFHISNDELSDRAGALEETFEWGASTVADSLRAPMDQTLSQMVALKGQPYHLPVLCINTTRVQDGNPGVVTNIRLSKDIFNNRADVLELLNDTLDMRLSTASIMGARFPYISPAGRIDEYIEPGNRVRPNDSMLIHYFVDGGYFDNSGAGVVQEMIKAMLNNADSTQDKTLKARMRKLNFVILHITNSPVGVVPLTEVSPLKNDLSSPLLTILGAYDMQTTVNDKRLINYLKDVDRDSTCNRAEYYPIHLYKDSWEKKADSIRFETPYAMNWFISDTTLRRMDHRLQTQPKLKELINRITTLSH